MVMEYRQNRRTREYFVGRLGRIYTVQRQYVDILISRVVGILRPARALHLSPGQRPGLTMPNDLAALKGQGK